MREVPEPEMQAVPQAFSKRHAAQEKSLSINEIKRETMYARGFGTQAAPHLLGWGDR
ncbi:MAG: hypothetical protein ACRERR_14940 [Moraxellaceae bacterium]